MQRQARIIFGRIRWMRPAIISCQVRACWIVLAGFIVGAAINSTFSNGTQLFNETLPLKQQLFPSAFLDYREDEIRACLQPRLTTTANAKTYFPSDPDYDFVRRGTNGRSLDYFPELVIFPQQTSDVQGLVQCASMLRLQLNAKSGGHSYEVAYVSNGGLLLDMGDMNNYEGKYLVDATQGSWIQVQGGIRLARFAGMILKYTCIDYEGAGERCPYVIGSGTYVDNGLVGHSICGGYGFLSRKLGYMADQILELTMVLSDGNVVTVNKGENTELYNIMRGACSTAFGIVVSLKVMLHRLETDYLCEALINVEEGPYALASDDNKARAFQWITDYGPNKAPLEIMMYEEFNKGIIGGHFMGGKDECIEKLWTDDGYKALARIIGISTTVPPTDWFIETKVKSRFISWYSASQVSTVDGLLAYTGPVPDRSYGGSFWIMCMTFSRVLPLDAIKSVVVNAARDLQMKTRGGLYNVSPVCAYVPLLMPIATFKITFSLLPSLLLPPTPSLLSFY